MKVCIVIPAYNEQERIVYTLDDYRKTLIKKYGNDVGIIVVSESTDLTNNIVKKYAASHKQITLVAGKGRSGKGGALIKGFEIACKSSKWDVIGFVDSDLSVSGTQIMKMLDRLGSDGKIDGVIASRYIEGSQIIGDQKASRFLASRAYNIMLRVLFGFSYKDTQCGAKFFRAKALRSILAPLSLTDMSFDLDLLYEMKKRGTNVIEVPITYRMIYEGTKLRINKQGPQMFLVAIGYRLTKSPLNKIIPRKVKGSVYNWIRRW